MDLKTENLFILSMPAPKGPIPSGLKETAIAGPDTLNPAASCPVLAIGSFTLWPMSYIDNRMSFGMVMYDPADKLVKQVEIQGARYIYKITKSGEGEAGTVTFWGQANQSVTLSLSELIQMMLK